VLLVQEGSNYLFHILDLAMHVDPMPRSIDHSSQVPYVVIIFGFESSQISPSVAHKMHFQTYKLKQQKTIQ
jgi:hypothetical protein